MGKPASVAILVALALGVAPAAADPCRKVVLDASRPSAPVGGQPSVKNLGAGEVYLSLATAPVEDLSDDPHDIVRATGFVLGPGEGVGAGTTHLVMTADNETYVVQLAKRALPATVEICGMP